MAALRLGLAKVIGKPHYDIQEFGVMPLTPLSWILIVSFWILMAVVLTLVTALIQRKLEISKKESGDVTD